MPRRKQTKLAEVMEWTDYKSVETIHEWLDSLQAEFPGIVTVTNIGYSTQGRPLKLLKLSKKAVIEIFITLLTDKAINWD